MQSVAGSVQTAATSLNESTLPEVNRLARDSRQAVRSFDRAASHFNDSPQSVLFGGSTALPGPGEKGFQSPAP
jgi:phospholipid/cholesterol/gamma-HCH transport system substrate-binding protein